jgi:hypothetical protein
MDGGRVSHANRPKTIASNDSLPHKSNECVFHPRSRSSEKTPVPCKVRGCLHFGDVLRLHALPALGYLVGDLLALCKGPKPGTLYIGVVDKNVSAPVVWGEEAVAFLLVEPPNCSLGHMLVPAFLCQGLHRNKEAALSSGRRFGRDKSHLLLSFNHTIAKAGAPYDPSPKP